MYLIYFLFYLLLGSAFSPEKADGLNVEKIIGGLEVHKSQFKYVVAVMYRLPGIPDVNPCTGSILGDWYIVTVAHCFFDKLFGVSRNASFYIIAGTVDIKERLPWTRYIGVDTVTIPTSYHSWEPDNYDTEGNLAVVKLNESLHLIPNHPALTALFIRRHPKKSETGKFFVASYGWNIVHLVLNDTNDEPNLVQYGTSDGTLKYGHADVLTNKECEDAIGGFIAEGNMCAKIKRSNPRKPVGICQYDGGAPLVNRDYLEGIAINGFMQCDDDQFPGIYIDIYYYKVFITNILREHRTENMLVLQLQEYPANNFHFVPI